MKKTQKSFLRLAAWMLVLTFLLGSAPVQAKATPVRTVDAIPYTLEVLGAPDDFESPFTPSEEYAPDEIVDVIVELEDAPLLKNYGPYETMSLSSDQAQLDRKALLANQDRIFNRITALTDGQAQLQWQYTAVLNGFALKVPYGELADIRNLPGVKDVFVAAINELVEPAMDSASELGNVLPGRLSGYTGAGVTIAIIDTGLDTDHPAFVHAPAGAVVGEAEIAAAMDRYDLTCEGNIHGLTAADTYVSKKVPFAFDYADLDTDVNPDNAPDVNNVSHGTHVAGIAAGYAVDEEGEVLFSGVAPDAQLLILKAFPDDATGTPDTITLAALEDAVMLGADVINMSLGTDCGFSTSRDRVISEVYARVHESGISLVCAAGNSYDAALRNNTGSNMTLPSDPDTGVISSPASFPEALAVASADNLIAQLPSIEAGGRSITYTDTLVDIRTIAGTYEYVVINGVGTAEDYAAAGDLGGKIALVRRGELTFSEKVINGQNAGACAVIVCDNKDGALSNMSVEGAEIPAIFITKADGDYLIALENKVLTVFETDQTMVNPSAGQISEFSSLGVTPELKLKPEITAPGGYIYSALPESLGGYGSMSGTSMATPFTAGAAALVRQQLAENDPSLSGADLQDRVNLLLMSTAKPITDSRTGNLYTPRIQGSGLIDVSAAISTPAYLHTQADELGSIRPVMNLGDDADRSGVYSLDILLTNQGDTDLRYALDVTALAPALEDKNGLVLMGNKTVQLDCTAENIRTVTVPAGETVEVHYELVLTDDDRNYLEEGFENGTYVEGFLLLKGLDGQCDLSAPFLGFFGDWTEAPIIDYGDWYTEPETALSFLNQAAGYVPYFHSYAYLGMNAFTAEQNYIPENFAISPNDDGYFDDVSIQVSLLRNAKTVRYSITTEDGELCYEFVTNYSRKNVYSAIYDMMVPMSAYAGFAPEPYAGTDSKGQPLPDGTRLVYSVEAELAYDDHESNNKKSTWSFPLLIDTSAPELVDMTVRFVTEGGRTYLEGTFADRNAMMDMAAMGVLIYGNSIYGDPSTREDIACDGSGSADFRFDVTGISSEYIYLMGYDSAYNAATYLIPTTGDETLSITRDSVLLNIGESAQVAVVDRSGNELPVVWTSSNEAVASVNENGVIIGRTSGSALVTATQGDTSVHCLVGVRPVTTVESFRLNVSEISVPVNSAAQLEIEDILPEGVYRHSADAVWTTTDPEVTGMYGQYFYADKVGTATITATIDGVSASCEVTVTPVDPDRELFICNEYGGEYPTMQSNYITDYLIVLGGRFRNSSGDIAEVGEPLIWTNSDPDVLKLRTSDGTVLEDGSILAEQVSLQHIGPGLGTITATTQDGSASRTYTVYVYPVQPLYLYLPSDVTVMEPGDRMIIDYGLDQYGSRPEDSRVFFKSLNEDVVTVEGDMITANRPGWAMVMGTLTSGYDNYMVIYVKETMHSWIDEVVEPTCTEGGYIRHTCEYCGQSLLEAEYPPLGHDWNKLDCTRCDAKRENPFTDVALDAFYFDPVLWALEKGITTGKSSDSFAPGEDCLRASVVTFLWRAAGEPHPESSHNPFVDVTEEDFFYHAVLWAVEQGITNGMDDTHFGPYETCNRAQVVTFLWRAQDKPAATTTNNPFTDVEHDSFYETAVLWAVEQGITNGLSADAFGPSTVCNRAQIVTFLYRSYHNG